MGKIITTLMVLISGYFIYQYRYRLVSFFANRNYLIAAVMKCPFLRDRVMRMVFPSPKY
ncbi:hypothetical protein ACUXCC_003842 [Cytobacillus horneckiae]|uniref:hypothetical protein n=1 Tax=Cytobacillus horneckiae TaxID=549687 RepID=UPI000AE05324|nr:hypothetical protein [Cytobacillus horneckiae]NRG43884.1 hypothetical protein [Bacillus sp. CRN 9]MBN6888865.1 hypothetical protein [Cytobacillus horneckiae]MCM3179954.1 hypothetical protein [Cytobacillus horneckiae]MEC1155343.1 hypothetical protein [Cytobacillus horneckiae]MED2936604.1 hypothetical protein [Cytobacillus horneckiae]